MTVTVAILSQASFARGAQRLSLPPRRRLQVKIALEAPVVVEFAKRGTELVFRNAKRLELRLRTLENVGYISCSSSFMNCSA